MSKIKILVIEDDSIDFELIERQLKNTSWKGLSTNIEMHWKVSLSEAEEFLKKYNPDVILLDYLLPDARGSESLKRLQSITPNAAIIIMTNLDDEDTALEALQLGAQDYLLKGGIDVHLIRSIRYAIERKTVNQRLKEAERAATEARLAECRFLANISHEIRTPLTAVIGFGEILRDKRQSEEVKTKSAELLLRNGKHLLNLINDLLDLSKIESGALVLDCGWFSPIEVIADSMMVFTPQAQKKSLRLNVLPTFPLPQQIYNDKFRLNQILFNLISNAIKFTDSGEISIQIGWEPQNDLLHFAVKDSGIGIPKDRQQVIFDAFRQSDTSTTRRFGGTGLGLAISRELVELLGGKLKVESTPGKGSSFEFEISTGTVDRESLLNQWDFNIEKFTHSSTESIVIPKLEGNVLMADDCESNRALVEALLQETGATLVLASDGEQAVKIGANHQIDLVLMDLHMPILDGFEATTQLRQLGFENPIVALTALAGSARPMDLDKIGFSDYLSKPFTQKDFYELLSKYLGKTQTSSLRQPSAKVQAVIKQVSKNFLEHLPGKIAAIEQALHDQNFDKLAQAAHRLAGAEMFGFPDIGKTAQMMERSSQAHELDNCKKLFFKLSNLAESRASSDCEVLHPEIH